MKGKVRERGINITKAKLYDKSQYSAPQSQTVNEFYRIRKEKWRRVGNNIQGHSCLW